MNFGEAPPAVRSAVVRTAIGLTHLLEDAKVIAPDQPECSLENLEWMLGQIISRVDLMPNDKVNRWLGFVQGVLAAKGIMNVQAERDRTRPLFHEAYAESGIDVPPTMNR
jgi:hypothetical protein